jgi:hypothetical protein
MPKDRGSVNVILLINTYVCFLLPSVFGGKAVVVVYLSDLLGAIPVIEEDPYIYCRPV